MENFQEKLDEYRRSIDRLDTILIYTLGERFKQTELIGRLKAEAKIQAKAQAYPRPRRRLGPEWRGGSAELRALLQAPGGMLWRPRTRSSPREAAG